MSCMKLANKLVYSQYSQLLLFIIWTPTITTVLHIQRQTKLIYFLSSITTYFAFKTTDAKYCLINLNQADIIFVFGYFT